MYALKREYQFIWTLFAH